MAQLRVGPLPDAAGAAAAQFYAQVWPEVAILLSESPLPFRGGVGGGACQASVGQADMPHPNPSPEGEGLFVMIIFPPADHTHRAWRLAAIQALARELAPARVNAVASNSEPAIAAACAFLEQAEGITGQVLELDDTGAGEVVSLPE